MSGRLPIWEIPLSENFRTKMAERHGDLTMTITPIYPNNETAQGLEENSQPGSNNSYQSLPGSYHKPAIQQAQEEASG